MQQQPLRSPDPPSPSLCPPCAARVLDTWGRACFVQFLDTRGQAYPPLRRHSPHISLTFHHTHPSSPATTPSPSATTQHALSFFWLFMLLFNCFSRYAVFPAPLAARFPIHIAPCKIVLTAPFFSLVLDVAICSPSLLLYAFAYHSAPLPGVKSHRKLHLAHHFFFGYFRCLYVYGRPPPIVSSSLYAARRHLSSNHTDFGKSPSLDFYSLPWIGALLSFYFVSRQFFFNIFACFNALAGARLILPSSPRRCSVRRASPAAPYCAFCGLICPHASPSIGACVTFNAGTPF